MQETQIWSLDQENSPGEGNDNPLQYFCLGNPMERETWKAEVHEIAKELDMTYRLTNSNMGRFILFITIYV